MTGARPLHPADNTSGSGAAPRRLLALAAGWLCATLLWLAAALWIFAHPAALPSDDALFFARGLTHFSVLELSPQFPGYPGFILLGRLLLPLAGDPVTALACATGGAALALPPLAGLVLHRHGPPGVALAGVLVTLAMPLLAALALGLLSDGPALACLMAFLALLPRGGDAGPRAAFAAGAVLGLAAACRPSDAVLILAAGGAALVALPTRRFTLPALAGFAAVLLPTAAGLLAVEPLYLSEGLRFTLGHALIWGNTPFSEAPRPDTWTSVLVARPALGLLVAVCTAAALAALPGGRGRPARAAAAAGCLGHLIWILAFQNPDSLRHLAPVLLLGPLAALLGPQHPGRALAACCLALGLIAGAARTDPAPGAPPPLERVRREMRTAPPDAALATNEGVFLLRAEDLPLRIFDMHYPSDARLGLSLARPAWRLTTTPLPGRRPERRFPARFPGEHGLYLYRLD